MENKGRVPNVVTNTWPLGSQAKVFRHSTLFMGIHSIHVANLNYATTEDS